MALIGREFSALLENVELVNHHSFTDGEDNGPYYNFTFGTTNAEALWLLVKERFYGNNHIGHLMKQSSMAMCSSEEGWGNYLLLCHFDPTVELDEPVFP